MGQSSTKRVALYLRQSLDRAEGIDSQRTRCTKMAESRGWEIADTFQDNETPASKPRGPETGWGRMLARIGEDFNVVIAVDLDRLLRNTRDLNTLVDRGAQVVTVDGEIDLSTADGEFRGTMLAGIARFESRRASERQRRSKQHRRDTGQWHGGIAPYGYRAEGGHLVPEETEVKRIKDAARRLLDDRETMASIVKDWNVKGAQTRAGKHWRQPNLRTILLNRAMLGETKAGVVGWEPIIDQRTFDRLNVLLTDPSRKVTHSPGVKTERYSMGGGLTVCAKCGKPLVTNTKMRNGSKVPALACLVRVQGPSEHHPRVEREVTRSDEKVRVWQESGRVTVSHDVLEEYVFDEAIERINATVRWHQRMSEVDPAIDAAIDTLEADRSVLREQRERAGKAFVLGVMSEREVQHEVERIDIELESIERRINDLLGRPVIANVLEDGIDWRTWTPGRRRAFLRLLIDRVEVGAWPDGFTRRVIQQRGEPDDAYAERQKANVMTAMSERVRILWRDLGGTVRAND